MTTTSVSFARPPENVATPPKPILIVSSQVAQGAVGGRGATFALQRLGHEVVFAPTVQLPWHPGHGPATRILPPIELFSQFLRDLISGLDLADLGGIVTGYLGEAAQAGPIAELIVAAQAANNDLIYLCDPVIGDRQGIYVPNATAEAIRKTLLPLAHVQISGGIRK